MLTLTFHAPPGEHSIQARAISFRLCADATLRGHDNSVAATRVNGSWLVRRRLFRQFECAGPVLLLVRSTAAGNPICIGPFRQVRAGPSLIWGDGELLTPRVPGWAGRDAAHEVTLFYAPEDPEPGAPRPATPAHL